MDEDFAAALADDMARLDARPYAEVGVPMFLVAENLAGGMTAPIAPDPTWPPVGAVFARMGATLAERRPGFGDAEVARLIEVLADRYIVEDRGPFTRLTGQ